MEIQTIKTSDITPYFNNPRKNDEAVAKVAESIKAFGFRNPILLDKDNVIIAGHTRWKAALLLKIEECPCIVYEDMPEDKVKAYRIADNRIGEFAEWDWEALKVEMEDFDQSIVDLLDFEIPDTTEITGGLTDDDDVPEIEESICKPGDLWKLGDHRLLCGDSTNVDDVERLMDGDKADMVFTDPPYGVDYSSKNEFLNKADKGNRHELIVYGWKDHHKFYGDTDFTIWNFDKPLKSDLHPTMKPVELIEKAILNSSKKDMIIYDPFLGSGSTLIACEKTNRKCYGMEIDPHYCDVIIKRWEDYTGKKGELING